jgi:hypothetical protein
MITGTRMPVTATREARYFLAPDALLHRQYEALRAYFVDNLSSTEVARRFGYSAGAFRNLCFQFRHDPRKQDGFFRSVQHGPRTAPVRDRVRDLVVALRKQNLSVYDIQNELAKGKHTISITALTLLLREEGFAALPRRRDEDRPPQVKPEIQAVADVRVLDLSPRTFDTPFGGLFFFIPLMRDVRLAEVVRQADLPGSFMVPAEQAVRTLLALKLLGKERTSQVMNLVSDQGIALFAGLNVVPKRSFLAGYSSQIDDRVNARLMAAWFQESARAGLARGSSLDLDFHAVPANTHEEPLEKHYVSRRSRSQQGILTFLARDASQRVLCYARAGITKAEQPDEIIRFVDFWQHQTGKYPEELVFDSRLTTYPNLQRLQERAIRFITLRRRTKKMLGAIWSQPASAWRRITLPSLTRAFRTPKVLEERIRLKGYTGELRQITVTDLGHEDPTILLTNHERLGCPTLVTRYAQRMLIENGIAEAIGFFHIDALSSMIGLKVDFDLQVTLMASSLYRLLAAKVGGLYQHGEAKTLYEQLLAVSATVSIEESAVIVQLKRRAHNPLVCAAVKLV